MRLEREIELPAAPERVYDLVMDPHRLGDWVSIHDGLEEAPEGGLENGSTLVQNLKVAGQGFTVRWTVVEADRPTRARWTGKGPAWTDASVIYGFRPSETGTHFTYVNEYELPGGALGRVAGRAVSAAANREIERSLGRLSEVLARG
jgi:carbon monoxide dehydrogenase subunit G